MVFVYFVNFWTFCFLPNGSDLAPNTDFNSVSSVIVFIKKLLAKDPQVTQHFESQILRYVIYFLLFLKRIVMCIHDSHPKGLTMQFYAL